MIDYFCPKCQRHMKFVMRNLDGKEVYKCPEGHHIELETRHCDRCREIKQYDEKNKGRNYGAGEWMCQDCINQLRNKK